MMVEWTKGMIRRGRREGVRERKGESEQLGGEGDKKTKKGWGGSDADTHHEVTNLLVFSCPHRSVPVSGCSREWSAHQPHPSHQITVDGGERGGLQTGGRVQREG